MTTIQMQRLLNENNFLEIQNLICRCRNVKKITPLGRGTAIKVFFADGTTYVYSMGEPILFEKQQDRSYILIQWSDNVGKW